jgi:hypothetical protein
VRVVISVVTVPPLTRRRGPPWNLTIPATLYLIKKVGEMTGSHTLRSLMWSMISMGSRHGACGLKVDGEMIHNPGQVVHSLKASLPRIRSVVAGQIRVKVLHGKVVYGHEGGDGMSWREYDLVQGQHAEDDMYGAFFSRDGDTGCEKLFGIG